MKKLTILIVVALLCPFIKICAQNRYSTKPLNVGDSVPDITIKNIINFSSKSIRLADYNDKLVILDFWSLFCIPCIKHMPAIDSLQRQFGNNVLFLPVNSNPKYDTPTKIAAFFKDRKKDFNLPSVISDIVLWELFQPPALGTYVWIKNGKVQQITDGEEVTAVNLKKAISEESLEIRQTERIQNDGQKPLFSEGYGKSMPAKYFMRSMIFPYSPGLEGAGWQTDSTGKVFRVTFVNSSVYSLLLAANPNFTHFYNRVKKETKYPDLLRENFDTDSIRKKFMFSYEAIFAPVSRKKAADYIKQDMARYFPYELDSIQVVDSCWVLKLSGSKKLITHMRVKAGTNLYENFGSPIYFNDLPISALRFGLEQHLKIPVLDETGYQSNVWIDLPSNVKNSVELTKALKKQGILLTKAVRAVEYLLIKDRADL